MNNKHAALRTCTVAAAGLAPGNLCMGYAVGNEPRRAFLRNYTGPTLVVHRSIVDGRQTARGPWVVAAPNGRPIPGLTFATLRNGAAFARDVLGFRAGTAVAKRGTITTRAARIVARYAKRHGGQGPATLARNAPIVARIGAAPF